MISYIRHTLDEFFHRRDLLYLFLFALALRVAYLAVMMGQLDTPDSFFGIYNTLIILHQGYMLNDSGKKFYP